MAGLAEVARRSDEAVVRARDDLVRAVRHAANSGMTQTEIAREIGRSQPEVSRLLRFQPATERGRELQRRAGEVRRIVSEAGGSNVRVFGSVARGEEEPDSDVDLLFSMDKSMGLFALSAVERQLSELLQANVDLVPDSSLRPDLRERVLEEAVRL